MLYSVEALLLRQSREVSVQVCYEKLSRVPRSWLLLVLAALSMPAHAVSGHPSHPAVDPRHVDGSSLGGPLDLTSTWLFKQGDDPSYADPHLDDRQWTVIRTDRSLDTYGFKNIDQVWYRTHVHIPANSNNLAILLRQFSGSEQIFVNGVEVGSSGTFAPGGTRLTNWIDRRSPIPNSLLGSGDLTIAVRARIGRKLREGPEGGFTAVSTLLLGPGQLLADQSTLYNLRNLTSNVTNLSLETLLLLVAVALAITLRGEREYLALVVYLTADLSGGVFQLWGEAHNLETSLAGIVLGHVLNMVAALALLEFVRRVLALRRSVLFAGYQWVLVLVVFPLSVVQAWSFHSGGVLPYENLIYYIGLSLWLPYRAGLPVLSLWIWWKRRNPDALLLSVPLFLGALAYYYDLVRSLAAWYQGTDAYYALFTAPPIPVFYVQWNEVSQLLFSVALLLFLVLRTLSVARARTRIAAEIQAVQTVQKVLLERSSEPTPGFIVQSVYQPAGEVGGDFFVVSPGPLGSLIAIVGDVSGKGLTAAMRVAMILGVLRREESREPATILAHLNQALLNQGEMGFTTACCVQLDPDGCFTIANAGHISPYIDGREIETAPALPLGLAADVTFDVVHGMMSGGQTMVLMSDGIVEARSPQGELYGFERLPELTRMPAQAIADVAQSFGQEDDITVLTIACAC
jgi:sigma-B regulation protein RsbU (phosphoserine phosphatase)